MVQEVDTQVMPSLVRSSNLEHWHEVSVVEQPIAVEALSKHVFAQLGICETRSDTLSAATAAAKKATARVLNCILKKWDVIYST